MIYLVPNLRKYFSHIFAGYRASTPVEIFSDYITTQITQNNFGPITFSEEYWPPIVSSFTKEAIELDKNFSKLITYKKLAARFAKMALIKKSYANKSGICSIQNLNEGIVKEYTITISFSNTAKEFTVSLKN